MLSCFSPYNLFGLRLMRMMRMRMRMRMIPREGFFIHIREVEEPLKAV